MEPYTLPLCNVIFDGKTELPQEFDATLPEYLPGIAKIVRADADAFALKAVLADGKITFTGQYHVRLLYNDDKKGTLKCAVFPRDFSHTWDASGIPEPVGTAVLEENACLLSVAAKPQSARSIRFSLGLALKVTVFDCGEISLLSPENTEVELHAANVLCCCRKKVQSEPADKQEDITLDGSMAPIADIADYSAAYRLDDISCADGLVRYRGTVLFKCVYRSDDAENENAEYVYLTKELPFDGEIAAPEARHGMTVIGRVRPEETQVSSAFDAYGENRVVHISLGWRVFGDLLDEASVTYFDDGFCPAYECDFEKNAYTYDTAAQVVEEHIRFEETLRADREGFTEIADAGLRFDALSPEIVDGRLFLSGRGFLWVTGADEKGETVGSSAPVHLHLPLESVRELSPEKRFELNAEARNGEAVLRDGEIVFTCDFAVTGIAFTRDRVAAIDRADIHYDRPKPLCHAEYIVYYPEKDETLWSIAKKYEISRDILRKAGGFTGDTLPPNKKTIVIPCG